MISIALAEFKAGAGAGSIVAIKISFDGVSSSPSTLLPSLGCFGGTALSRKLMNDPYGGRVDTMDRPFIPNPSIGR
jgi:hypothetical protein